MRKFLEISKKPLVIGIIASLLYIIDAFVGRLFVENASFMWVGFAFWTVFFGATVEERVRGFIGTIIGFFAAVLMMFITSSFTLNVSTISISCLLGVFVVNCLVMYLDHTKKFWTNSITGVFVGIMLTFSGFGIGMNPISSFKEGGIMLAILAVYAVLGLLCGYFSLFFTRNKKQNLDDK